jgi:hypothetical protein
MDILAFLKPVVDLLASKFDLIKDIGAYGMAFAIAWGLLIEIFEIVVAFTATKADDEFAAKMAAIRAKILPFLEILPHTNIPVAAFLTKLIAILSKTLKIGKAASDAAKE